MQEELCICIPCRLMHIMLACISRKNSTNHEECWLILTGLPSLTLDSLSSTGLSDVWCQLPNCHSVSLVANCLLWVPLSNSLLAFSSYFRSRRDLESKPFVWFCAKTDKGIVCLADHLHSVTPSVLVRNWYLTNLLWQRSHGCQFVPDLRIVTNVDVLWLSVLK